ncbi:MAG TPA: hypothetical protein PKA64_08275, partial [Myxococcota bacterium]|nr:hypothetical protein [Myxococcota bacterium]
PRPSYVQEVRASLGRGAAFVLLLAIAGSILHQLGPVFRTVNGWPVYNKMSLWEWYIEDAAISFSYARNWVAGDGLVAFPGGERIEGFSNPTWVALMAIFQVIGVDPFLSSKLMALVFGAVTVVIAWLIALEVVDDRRSPAALIAPIFLAVFPQFAFWNASGLENSLFCLLLAGGMWRVLVEARHGGYPWSAVWFLLLAATRPEGIMYAAWGGFLAMVFAVTQGRGMRSTLQWLATFFVPFVGYQAVRYYYFAWPFPNTYYAKLGDKEFKPFAWTSRGWKYIRGWASGTFEATGKEGTNIGWFTPVYLAAALGLRGRRAWLVPASTVALAALLLYPKPEIASGWSWWPTDLPEPTWWKEVRVWGLFGLALALPIAGMRDGRSRGRVLCWGMALLTFFFCILSGGDWMRGFRWMNFLSVPAAALFAVGVEEMALLSQRWFAPSDANRWTTPAWLVAPLLVAGVMPGFYFHSEWFFGKRETGPYSVQKRVDYTAGVVKKLYLEDQLIHNLDVDMGAHTWWSEHLMVDMAGLLDITIAHHNFSQRAVTKEYVFEEMRPEIAHVHGGWANSSRIPTFPEWKNGYFEIPPFPISSTTTHVGTYVRRDLVMLPAWTGAKDLRMDFDDGLAVVGYTIPSPEVSVGKSFYLEVGVQYAKAQDRKPFRLLGFLSDANGRLEAFDLPPAYDWLPVDEWRPEEVFVGKFAPPLEKALEPGDYDLGFVLYAEDGGVIQPLSGQAMSPRAVVGGRDGVEARFAAGEIRYPNALHVGEAGTGEKAARDDFERAMELAKSTDCEEAEAAWRLARLHLPRADKWQDDNRAELAPALAACWTHAADEAESDEEAAGFLARARVWDHRAPQLWETARVVGDRLYQQGMDAREAGDWQRAFDAFIAAVTANPSLAWARRYAEEARDHRLKIDPDSLERAATEREERIERMKEQQRNRDDGAGENKAEPAKKEPPPEGQGGDEPARPVAVPREE